MVPHLNSVFLALLHPQNTRKLRGMAVALVFDLIERLSDPIQYISGFIQYLFNWESIRSKSNSETINIPVNFTPGIEVLDDEPDNEASFSTQMEELHGVYSLTRTWKFF